MDTLSFAVACNKFFGRLPEQTVGQFVRELKELTEEDRKDLRPLLAEALGVEVTT